MRIFVDKVNHHPQYYAGDILVQMSQSSIQAGTKIDDYVPRSEKSLRIRRRIDRWMNILYEMYCYSS